MPFQKIITISQNTYACTKDADFPHIMLLSFPFSDMLAVDVDQLLIKQELEAIIQRFQENHVTVAAMACNTLHAFLPSRIDGFQLIHMIDETKAHLDERGWKNPLVLCSSTASKSRIHANSFQCHYPEPSTQKKIDDLIEAVTKGCCLKKASSELSSWINKEESVVLGCTELSVVHEAEPLIFSNVCNPNQIVAEKICEFTFQSNGNQQ